MQDQDQQAKTNGVEQQAALPIHFDRGGKVLGIGQTVRIQYCNGRYGQTRRVTCILQKIGAYGEIDVDTGKAGEGKYLYPGFSPDKSLGQGALRGYHKHVDFEHGHETWIEIVD